MGWVLYSFKVEAHTTVTGKMTSSMAKVGLNIPTEIGTQVNFKEISAMALE